MILQFKRHVVHESTQGVGLRLVSCVKVDLGWGSASTEPVSLDSRARFV